MKGSAKHSRVASETLECFVAYAHCNDDHRDTHSQSRRAFAPERCWQSPSQEHGGRREGRVPAAPAAPCAKNAQKAHTGVTTGRRNHTGPPCAVVYGLLRALPSEPACLPPSQATMRQHRGRLDACMGAPGPHDFAVRDRAARRSAHPRPPRARLACRDDRDTPLRNRGGCADNTANPNFWKVENFRD